MASRPSRLLVNFGGQQAQQATSKFWWLRNRNAVGDAEIERAVLRCLHPGLFGFFAGTGHILLYVMPSAGSVFSSPFPLSSDRADGERPRGSGPIFSGRHRRSFKRRVRYLPWDRYIVMDYTVVACIVMAYLPWDRGRPRLPAVSMRRCVCGKKEMRKKEARSERWW